MSLAKHRLGGVPLELLWLRHHHLMQVYIDRSRRYKPHSSQTRCYLGARCATRGKTAGAIIEP